MKCSYIRQTSEFSQFYYLKSPAEFDTPADGQRHYKNMVFLANPNDAEAELFVESLGYEISDPKKNLINRLYPHSMIIHYIVGGHGFFNGKPIRRGDCVVAECNKPHTLRTDPEDTLEFYWVMLRSRQTPDTSRWGFPKGQEIFRYGFEEDMRRIFREMLYFDRHDCEPYWFYMGKLYELIAFHTSVRIEKAEEEKTDYRFSHTISFAMRMWEQTNYQLSVEDIARSLGFSRKYFSAVFRKYVGITPQDYVVDRRNRMAKIRLDAGESNLKTLAYQLGYSDYSSFSRAFKRAVGISPQEYQRQAQNGTGHPDCRDERGAAADKEKGS